MPKTVRVLLTENVENVGIVGDVVNVRAGFARNYLLPHNLATTPTEEAIAAVAQRRAEAQRQLAELRRQREELIARLAGAQITIVRSCNELGHLYGSVTQPEIAAALAEAGYPGVRPRDVRLNQHIKRVDTFDILIKFDTDLETTIRLTVAPDRPLELPGPAQSPAAASDEQAPAGTDEVKGGHPSPTPPDAAHTPDDSARRSRKAVHDAPADKTAENNAPDQAGQPKSEATRERAKKGRPRSEQSDRDRSKPAGEAPAADRKSSGWGVAVSKPDFDLPSPRRGKKR